MGGNCHFLQDTRVLLGATSVSSVSPCCKECEIQQPRRHRGHRDCREAQNLHC